LKLNQKTISLFQIEWHSKGQGFESPILHLIYNKLRQRHVNHA